MLAACPLKSVWSFLTDHQSVDKKNGAHHPLRPHGLPETLPKVCHNLGSLSDMIETSTPCNRRISQIYNQQNSSSVKVICTARKCADLMSRSTITHTTSCLCCVRGKFVTKAIVTCSNFHSATSKGWSSLCWLQVLNFYLLTCETLSNKIPNVSLNSDPIILATKITVHLRATWIHSESRVVEVPEDLLSQIGQLGNHDPSHIPKTTICVDGPAFGTHT